MSERPKKAACHDRAERNDPDGRRLLENEEVAIRTQAGSTVEKKELLAGRFVKKKKKKQKCEEESGETEGSSSKTKNESIISQSQNKNFTERSI